MRTPLLGGVLLFLLLAGAGPGRGQDKKKGTRPGEINTPPAKGERKTTRLKVGDPAPDFTLENVQSKAKVTLSRFRGQKPVVLIFGSYT